MYLKGVPQPLFNGTKTLHEFHIFLDFPEVVTPHIIIL